MTAPGHEPPAGPGRRLAVALAAIAITTLLVYAPVLQADFVNWDDPVYVSRNPELGSLDARFFQWAFSTSLLGNWHPLTLISLGIDHAIWGDEPLGYHLTNIVLHALNAGLAAWLAFSLFAAAGASVRRGLAAAVAVGAGFGVHPLHVESVAWVSERKDVLCAIFYLASLVAWVAHRRTTSSPARRRGGYLLSLACFALAASAKPMAVSLPVVLLILDTYPLRRPWSWRGLLGKAPFFAGALAVGLVTLDTQAASGAMEGMKHVSFVDRWWGAERALVFYLVKFVLPVGLVPLYPLDLDLDPLSWRYLGPLAVLTALTALAIHYRRRAPLFATAGAAYLVTLAPVLGLVQVGSQAAADRYTYLPMLAPLMIVGAGWAALWLRAGRRACIALAVLVLGLAAARTIDQIQIWYDSVSLWEHVIAAYPDNATAQYNLGNAHRDRRDLAAARRAWERTIEIEPRHSRALNALGNLASLERDAARAESLYRAAVEADAANAEAHYNLASMLERRGDRTGARRHYRRFLESASPSHAELAARVRRKLAGAE